MKKLQLLLFSIFFVCTAFKADKPAYYLFNKEGKDIKYEKMLKEKGGIKSYTFISEEIKEDKAIVKMTFEYGNGDKKDDRIKLVNKDGKWWLSNSK